jgi:hypothetical protein
VGHYWTGSSRAHISDYSVHCSKIECCDCIFCLELIHLPDRRNTIFLPLYPVHRYLPLASLSKSGASLYVQCTLYGTTVCTLYGATCSATIQSISCRPLPSCPLSQHHSFHILASLHFTSLHCTAGDTLYCVLQCIVSIVLCNHTVLDGAVYDTMTCPVDGARCAYCGVC